MGAIHERGLIWKDSPRWCWTAIVNVAGASMTAYAIEMERVDDFGDRPVVTDREGRLWRAQESEADHAVRANLEARQHERTELIRLGGVDCLLIVL